MCNCVLKLQNCQGGHKEVAALLIDRGAALDKANLVGSTPLYAAARVRLTIIVYFLLVLTLMACFTICK